MKLINIKENLPNTDYAVYCLEQEIEFCNLVGEQVLLVIHGYGSRGVGGLIKERVNESLKTLKRFKKIADYVPGEEWSDLNETKNKICKISPELIISQQLAGANNGVTVVLINEN